MKSSLPTLQYSFRVFHLVCKLFKGFFSAALSVSKLYELSLWIKEHTSEMSSNISINLYLRPCSIAIYGKFYLFYLTFFWSVNCENLIYKLCITFWKCQDTQTLFILECIFGKFNSNFPVLFLTLLLSGPQIVQVTSLVPFRWSGNCMSWVFESQNISWRFFCINIYRKIDLYYLRLFRLFLWPVNCTILVSKLSFIFQTILNFWPVLILNIFSSWDIKKGQFQFWVTFLAIFSGL